MTETEKAIFAAQQLSAIEQSVMRVAAAYNRHTEIGEYLRSLWVALAGITNPLDPETYEKGCEVRWLRDDEKRLISALEANDD